MYYLTEHTTLVVDITVLNAGKDRVRITGKGVSPEDDRVYEDLGAITTVCADTGKAVARKRNQIIKDLTKRYTDMYIANTSGEGKMRAAFETVEKTMKTAKYRCHRGGWMREKRRGDSFSSKGMYFPLLLRLRIQKNVCFWKRIEKIFKDCL